MDEVVWGNVLVLALDFPVSCVSGKLYNNKNLLTDEVKAIEKKWM